MIEKNEKSGELMEVKEQAKTVRKHPERMIVRIWLVLALICLLAGLIAQYTFRLKEPLFLHYSQSAYLGCGLDGVETSEDGIVSSVSSEALEEESTDSDVKTLLVLFLFFSPQVYITWRFPYRPRNTSSYQDKKQYYI